MTFLRRKRCIKWILPLVVLSCICLFYTVLSLNGTQDLPENNVHPHTIPPVSEERMPIQIERIGTTLGRKRSTVQRNIVHMKKTTNKSEERIDEGLKFKNTETIGKKVAIVSLLRNSEGFLESFGKQLMKLSYPHNLLSVYFGESGSTDFTFKKAENLTQALVKYCDFNDAGVTYLSMPGGIYGDKDFRHRPEFQSYRRSYLAAARNRIVRYAMQKQHFDYILTIDSDIVEFPADLVHQLLFARSDIVATACVVVRDGRKYIYDANSWRETDASLKHQSSLPLDTLMMEGYDKTRRIYLPQIRNEGPVVKLDGVGGCTLMIKADCFRSGLIFPDFLYKRHIETEGLAKMGRDMGYSVVGLPFVEVLHYNGN